MRHPIPTAGLLPLCCFLSPIFSNLALFPAFAAFVKQGPGPHALPGPPPHAPRSMQPGAAQCTKMHPCPDTRNPRRSRETRVKCRMQGKIPWGCPDTLHQASATGAGARARRGRRALPVHRNKCGDAGTNALRPDSWKSPWCRGNPGSNAEMRVHCTPGQSRCRFAPLQYWSIRSPDQTSSGRSASTRRTIPSHLS